jgi:hypothetical protein
VRSLVMSILIWSHAPDGSFGPSTNHRRLSSKNICPQDLSQRRSFPTLAITMTQPRRSRLSPLNYDPGCRPPNSFSLDRRTGSAPTLAPILSAVGNLELGFVKGTMTRIGTTTALIAIAMMIARVAVAQAPPTDTELRAAFCIGALDEGIEEFRQPLPPM